MSKKTYIFEYAIFDSEHTPDQVLTHKFRAMNEDEAWRRFRFFTQNNTVTDARISYSDDPLWTVRMNYMTYGGVPVERIIEASYEEANEV